MKRTLATLLILVPCGAALTAGNASFTPRSGDPAGGEATFEGLGDLPGGSVSSIAYDVSADGSVVVGQGTPESGVEAFRWENGQMEGLGSLPGAPFQSSSAYGVSLDGSVIVGQSNSKEGFRAFRYENGVMVDLGTLTNDTGSGAYGVSDDGLAVVGFSNGPAGLEAFRWMDGTMEGLGHLPDGINSTSRATSGDGGVVVGQSQVGGINEEMAFRWENGEMVGLGYLAEFGFTSWAYDVTADGAIVVGLSQSDFGGDGEGGDEAFLWQDGEMVGLGELPGGFRSSWAHGVSDDGTVVVGVSSSEEHIGGEAFIWTAEEGMRGLMDVLVNDHDIDLTGWTLREATAVSADGTVIVGNGVNPNGDDEAWRVMLPPVGAAELTFDPPTLAFGDIEVGTTSPPQTATLHNTGDTDATGIAFSGLPDAGFAADTSACGDTLPAGGSCAVSVTFTPGAPGPATAALHVDGTEGAMADLALSGSGVGGGGPVADISPAAFDFEAPQGGSDSGTLNIGNAGDADLTWSLAEAATFVARKGMPYTYGLAWVPELHAPVGADRASAARTLDAEAADPIVLPAPQPRAIDELSEGFDDITQLPGAGWAMINNSEPVGPSSWFQGNDSIFPSHEGAADAYIAANFESTDGAGDISNWLLTPEVTIANGTELCLWTRTTPLFEEFLDRLEVRMSVAGDSTDVGDTAESVGDFTELLLTIEPDLELPNEYPEEWTEFCVTVRERSREPVTGRFAFRYWVTDSGANGSNGDYIGIDTVSVTQPDDIPPGGCDNPSDIPWLAADPTSGTTAPGGSEPVTVTVDATDLEVGEHAAQLCVTTNDPNAPLVTVPLSLTVSVTGEASFEGLGFLSEVTSFSRANDVSGDGTIVVGASESDKASPFFEAFRWTVDSGMDGLGFLPNPSSYHSAADGVSFDGSVVVGNNEADGEFEAFRWDDGEMEGLGFLPEIPNECSGFSAANGVSADGSVVIGEVCSVETAPAFPEAFRWTMDGGMVGLGFLPGQTIDESRALGVSSDGSVVVGASWLEAFRWADGEMEGLGDLPGGDFWSEAKAVSADGSVIVGFGHTKDGTEAVRWVDGEIEGLGRLSKEHFESAATGVSDDGSVIIGYSAELGSPGIAFIWTEEEGMRSLQEVLENDYGLDLTGWTLYQATAISSDGSAIVGFGDNPDGLREAWRAFLAKPVTDKTTPEEVADVRSPPSRNLAR